MAELQVTGQVPVCPKWFFISGPTVKDAISTWCVLFSWWPEEQFGNMLYLLKTLIRIERNAREGLLKKDFLGSKEMKERRRKEGTKRRKEEKRK